MEKKLKINWKKEALALSMAVLRFENDATKLSMYEATTRRAIKLLRNKKH